MPYVILPDVCVACRACIQQCPSLAISDSDSGFVIDENRCTCCGACLDVCFAQAIILE